MWWNTQWAFAGVRDPEHKDFALAKGYDDGRWVFTGDTSKVSGQVKGIPDLPITVMAEAKAELKILPKGARALEHQALPRPLGARALERLRHRPAAAGRPARRRGGVPEGDARWSPSTPTAS